ncbi:hypothetical protein JCM3765_005116 [Sporobolomyces pararoseus]
MSTVDQRDTSASTALPASELETEPASPTFASTTITRSLSGEAAPPVRAKPPTRRYGKQKVVEDEEVGQKEETESTGKPLDYHSTVIIPETDPDDDRMRMEMDKERAEMEGDSSSQADLSEPRSTSPTSTEGEGEGAEEKATRQKTKSILANLSDESSDEEEGGAIDFFKRNGNIADQLKAIDEQMDRRDQSSPARPSKAVPTLQPPTSSSLPTLTESDPASNDDNLSSQPTPQAARQQLSSRILSQTDEDESQQVLAPTARSRAKKPRAIIDSEDEEEVEEEEAEANRARKTGLLGRSVVPESSDHEGDVGSSSPVRVAPSAPAPSKQERLQALALKKKAAMAPVVSPPRKREEVTSDAIENESSEEEPKSIFTKKKKATGKSKVKGLTKKAEEEMHKMSATIARGQEARLEPHIKNRVSVTDILKNARSNRHDSTLSAPSHSRSRQPQNEIILSSSDSIVNTSSPRARLSHQPSAKALGKQRAESPIEFDDDNEATPQGKKKISVASAAAWANKNKASTSKEEEDDSDEDLLSLEEQFAKQDREKREKEEKERERLEKRRAREARIKALQAKVAEDSDSDIEIEGQPQLPPRPPPIGSRRISSHHVSTPRPGTQLHHIVRDLAHVDPSHHEDPTDSQLQCAGRDFGRNLDPAHHYAPSPSVVKSKNRASTSKAHKHTEITKSDLDHVLLEKTRRQAIQSRLEKSANYRRQLNEQTEQTMAEPERIDVKGMLEKKKKQQEEQRDEDERIEEEEDSDYKAESEEEAEAQMSEDEANGSGSDVPAEPLKTSRGGGEVELEEGEFDSDGELVMPASSQNSDRLGHRDVTSRMQDMDEEEEEEEEQPVARKPNVKPRVVVDDEEEEEEARTTSFKSTVPTVPEATEVVPSVVAPAAAPVRMALDVFGGGGDDDAGGFSQFFNSQFSQAVGGDNDGEGFARAAEPSMVAPTMFAAEPLISTAERAADAALLEARGAVHNIEPGTPRETVIPRQYINKQGFMTQTRPVGLFADSPSFSPRDSQIYQDSLSTARDSQSQSFTQTQIDATPTQAHRHPKSLRRHAALIRNDSLSETQPDPTEVVEEEDGGESFPSAAQPRDAFSVLRQGAALESIPEKVQMPKRRREMNAFVDDQANLDSDEEQVGGLNAASGDEDEEGHDAELEELVDNAVISEELQAEQDARARELHQEELDKQEAANLKRAQNIADGKERNKRKTYDLDDDDFDDEYSRQERREKQQRIDSMTVVQLHENEKTRSFAKQLQATCGPDPTKGDFDMFDASQTSDHERDQDDDEYEQYAQESQDFFGGHQVNVKTTYNDVRAEAVQRQRELEEARLNEEEIESQLEIHLGNSSSPVVAFKTNNRIHAATSKSTVLQPRKDNYDDIESQYSIGRTDSFGGLINYKTGDSREESQTGGSGNGMSAGGRSAVTSFKKGGPSASRSTSSTSSSRLDKKGSSSSSTTGSKSGSKFSAIRSKNSFAS